MEILTKVNSMITNEQLTIDKLQKMTSEQTCQLAYTELFLIEINNIIEELSISHEDLGKVLGISERSVRNFFRIKAKLSLSQTERLLKYIQLLISGSETFGSNEAFNRWLHKPAFGLDFEMPIDLVDTLEGISLVDDEVHRIAFGDFS